ncbi:type IV pili methyl-accepting chemotaxis transducer N-terminal domain-containing protein [Chromobacterium sp.]|uniref:type IV pili methyl-accepting chemotaxis transducer N-terminal domain-containing protein n=1 Tax=Chromobacterium sp. TaxID=306190 RepID=UPI0035AF42C0
MRLNVSPVLGGPLGQRLSAKIVGVLAAFLVVALGSIGATLWLSWQQEGGAAAINDAGSLRMRVTRMALDLQLSGQDGARADALRRDMASYEQILQRLRRGDPARPLLVPREADIQQALAQVEEQWRAQLKPVLQDALTRPADNTAEAARFAERVALYVADINTFVSGMEAYNARNTDYLRLLQLLLASMAVVGTVALIYLMLLIVLRPLDKLHQGIRRLAAGDYSVRVPVETDDEFGQVSTGFNLMAECLSESLATLEERVRSKTASLQQKNQELALLYEITSFCNQSQPLEALCKGFLARVMRAFDADGGAVRLTDHGQGLVFVVADDGLPEALLREEHCLKVGDCLCGEAAAMAESRVENMGGRADKQCSREGFRVVSAFPVATQNRTLGIFNLHFRQARILPPQQVRQLEMLGQHLAVAIENLRLAAKERELAVLEERNLVAQGLHDSIAQGLSFLNLQTQIMRQALDSGDPGLVDDTLALFEAGVQESYDDVRELLNNFRSKLSESLGQAVSSLLDKFRKQTKLRVELRSTGAGAPLRPEQQLQILFILQEALSNVRKHAEASQVTVSLSDDGEVFVLSVLDNGVGFDLDTVRNKGDGHFGLSIMQERAQRAGLQLDIESTPDAGTMVSLLLPRARRLAA